MPAKLDNPFGESCCDGGECATEDMSTQPCGCDKGANWTCERHRKVEDTSSWAKGAEETATQPQRRYITSLVVKTPDGSHVSCLLELTPIGSLGTNRDLFWTQVVYNLGHSPQTTLLLEDAASLQPIPASEPKS